MAELDSVRQELKAEFPDTTISVTAEWTYSHHTKQDREMFLVDIGAAHGESSSLTAAVLAAREDMGVNVPGDPQDINVGDTKAKD